jgi:hypothetical protein
MGHGNYKTIPKTWGRAMAFQVLLSAALLAGATAQARAQSKFFLGEGNAPCGSWTTERKANSTDGKQLSAWARGYVSGANVMQKFKDNIFAKNTAELNAMMSWLDEYCRAHPSENLVVATDQLVKTLIER